MANQFSDKNFYKADEIRHMIAKGWLVAGAAGGTYKLTAAGLTKAAELIAALDFEQKLFVNYKVNANAEADPITFA